MGSIDWPHLIGFADFTIRKEAKFRQWISPFILDLRSDPYCICKLAGSVCLVWAVWIVGSSQDGRKWLITMVNKSHKDWVAEPPSKRPFYGL